MSVSAPLWGLAYGVLGSLLLSLYSLMIKRAMSALPVSNAALVGYVNANATALLGLVLLATPGIKAAIPPLAASAAPFWLAAAAVALAAYLLSLATMLQLQYTSALTHNVSGTAKATLQSLLGWVVYRNDVSAATAAGTVATIAGCAAYAYVRQQQQDQQRAAAAAQTAPAVAVGSARSGSAGECESKVVTAEADGSLPYPCWARALAKLAHRFVVPPPKEY